MDGVRVYPWKELGVTSHEEAIPLVMGKQKQTIFFLKKKSVVTSHAEAIAVVLGRRAFPLALAHAHSQACALARMRVACLTTCIKCSAILYLCVYIYVACAEEVAQVSARVQLL